MVPPLPTPSSRLLRAAAAERAELERHRAKLLATRHSLRVKLGEIEASLDEIEERAVLLDRLTGPELATGGAEHGSPRRSAVARSAKEPDGLLHGPAIRRVAVQVLLEHPDRPEALHYRDWYDAVRTAGHAIAGKDPLAVFLTQLSRSPAVRKGTQSGVYELDRSAPRRLRHRLDELQEQLRSLATTPSPTADLTAVRARRAELNARIGRLEKALEEAEAVLASPDQPRHLAAAG